MELPLQQPRRLISRFMGFWTYEPVADGAEEGFSLSDYQCLCCSLCLFGVLLRTIFCELNCTFSDLSERDLERVRRMFSKKLMGQLTEELVTSISKQRSHFQLEKTASLTKAVFQFLTVLDRIILGVRARELTEVDSQDGRSSCSQEVGDPPTGSETDGEQIEEETVAGWDSLPPAVSDFVVRILVVPARELTEVDSQDGRLRFSREDGDPPTGSETDAAQIEEAAVAGWDSLPNDIHANILQRVDFQDLFRLKVLSKQWKTFIESDVLRQARGGVSEGVFTAINYYIKNNVWHCSGYDLHSRSWRCFPPVKYLPAPDAELFKEYSVCGHGGLMCAEVSKLPNKGELVVFNPLTGETRALPPLLHPRNPVLVHISVDSAKRSYRVIVSGSTASSQNWRKPNCKIMEVFDSSTSKWKETCNIPGPSFGLSKHQTGVCVNGILFFISALDADYRHPRGDYVLAWDMENWRYLENCNWACPIPFVPDSKSLLQLVENDGKVYLFSESKEDVQGPGIVWHRIDEMEFHDRNTGAMDCPWRNVVEVRKTSGQEIFDFRRGVADFMCVGFGKGKLCIFNTLDRDGLVYDMLDGTQCGVLEPPPAHQTGDKVFSLNPASFTLHPSFASDP